MVLHPKDESTDFLKHIYNRLENVTVIRGGINKNEIHDLIKEHDQVMMLGHGMPSGKQFIFKKLVS